MSTHELVIRSNETGALRTIRRDQVPASHESDPARSYWTASLSCGSLEASLRFYDIALSGLATISSS